MRNSSKRVSVGTARSDVNSVEGPAGHSPAITDFERAGKRRREAADRFSSERDGLGHKVHAEAEAVRANKERHSRRDKA